MKNAMQLKGIIKNMAAKTGIKANALLQNYMLERLLLRQLLAEVYLTLVQEIFMIFIF